MREDRATNETERASRRREEASLETTRRLLAGTHRGHYGAGSKGGDGNVVLDGLVRHEAAAAAWKEVSGRGGT